MKIFHVNVAMFTSVIALLFFASISSSFGASQPQIFEVIGEIEKGNILTINGADFGGHLDRGGESEYLNYAWLDCENSGSYVKPFNWSATHSRARLNSDNGTQRKGSKYNAVHDDINGVPSNFINIFGTTVSNYEGGRYAIRADFKSSIVFLSGWWRIGYKFTMSNGADQIKMNQICNSVGQKSWFHIDGSPEQTSPNNGWKIGSHVLESNRDDDGGVFMTEAGEWHRMDIYANLDLDVIEFYIDGKLYRSAEYLDNSPFANGIFTAFARESDVNQTMIWYTDDMYIDLTPARVEVSDSPTWSVEKYRHMEIQPQISWSDSEIKIKFNRGSFDITEPMYLYVINSNGQVNSKGYLLGDPFNFRKE